MDLRYWKWIFITLRIAGLRHILQREVQLLEKEVQELNAS